MNYYDILGIYPNASAKEIRRAYLGMSQLYHPDRVGAQGTVYFQAITEAYEVLGNAKRREEYDEQLTLESTMNSKESARKIWSKLLQNLTQ